MQQCIFGEANHRKVQKLVFTILLLLFLHPHLPGYPQDVVMRYSNNPLVLLVKKQHLGLKQQLCRILVWSLDQNARTSDYLVIHKRILGIRFELKFEYFFFMREET